MSERRRMAIWRSYAWWFLIILAINWWTGDLRGQMEMLWRLFNDLAAVALLAHLAYLSIQDRKRRKARASSAQAEEVP